jgi:hypothetical protein
MAIWLNPVALEINLNYNPRLRQFNNGVRVLIIKIGMECNENMELNK